MAKKIYGIRMSEELNSKIIEYCEIHNMNKTQFLELAILRFLENDINDNDENKFVEIFDKHYGEQIKKFDKKIEMMDRNIAHSLNLINSLAVGTGLQECVGLNDERSIAYHDSVKKLREQISNGKQNNDFKNRR